MTSAQEDAFHRVNEILSEHFETFALTVGYDIDDATENFGFSNKGGRATAIGLHQLGREHYLKSVLGASAPDGPTTD